jgi:hypothetical protein
MDELNFTGLSFTIHSGSAAAKQERCYNNRWISEPERNLMLAVLEDAISCFLGYRDGDRNGRNRLLFADARDWINSQSRYSIFAFRNLCEIVGINPDALKRELHKIRRGDSRRGVSLPRTFDVRSPSMSNTKVNGTSSARTRRARAPMATSTDRALGRDRNCLRMRPKVVAKEAIT